METGISVGGRIINTHQICRWQGSGG